MSLWSIVWRVGLFLTVWGVLLAAPVVLVSKRMPGLIAAYPQQSQMYFELVTAGAVVAAAWVMARFADGRAFSTLGFASTTAVRDVGIGASIGAGWLTLCLAALWAFGALTVPPGLTGHYQISFPHYESTLAEQADPEQYYISVHLHEKLALELRHVEEPGLVTDLRILASTLFAIQGSGARRQPAFSLERSAPEQKRAA